MDLDRQPAGRIKRLLGNLLLTLGSVGLMIGLVEVAGHALMRPSPKAFAAILGSNLPPFRVVPACHPESGAPLAAPALATSSAVVRAPAAMGGKPDRRDLTGIYRDDPVLGYAPKENAISPHGWWQSDNLGARSRQDAGVLPPAGEKRIIVFGESFGAGSRVRQEQTWSAVMRGELPDTEVLNFAVDGYSMGQAYLRFRELRRKIKYDAAMMMFVPGADLARDINVYRPLLAWGWAVYTPLPRFVLDAGRLRPIPRPDESRARFMAENCRSMSGKLHTLLARYDRFYIDARYGAGPPIIGQSVVYKLGARVWAHWRRQRIQAGLLRLHGEAFNVSRAIFRQMGADARQDGAKFVLVILPLESEIRRLRSDAAYRRWWGGMVASLCGDGVGCIDLSRPLAAAPEKQIDRGYDGTHYGPLANRLIGAFVGRQLIRQNLLADNARVPAVAAP